MPEITIRDNDGVAIQSFPCSAEEAVLLAAMRASPTPISVGCRGGGCGVCKVRIVSGQYAVGKMSRAQVSAQQEAEGQALACRLYPRSNLVLEVIGGFAK